MNWVEIVSLIWFVISLRFVWRGEMLALWSLFGLTVFMLIARFGFGY